MTKIEFIVEAIVSEIYAYYSNTSVQTRAKRQI